MKLILENISKGFDDKSVLRDVSFEFEEGYIYALLGRNGAGKTTLFNCLNDDLKCDSGEFYLVDEQSTEVYGNPSANAAAGAASKADSFKRAMVSDDIGYVLSTPVVPGFLTGRELVKFYIDINKSRIKNPKTIDEHLDFMAIPMEDRDRLMKDYSHGMKSKMMMLLNFISDPKVWLLDEPLTSLDVVVAAEIKKMLKSAQEGHITILSTHIMELATSLCDRIVLLKNGHLEEIVRGTDESDEVYEARIISALADDGVAQADTAVNAQTGAAVQSDTAVQPDVNMQHVHTDALSTNTNHVEAGVKEDTSNESE